MSLGGFLGGRYPSEHKRDGYFFGTYAWDGNTFLAEILKPEQIHTLAAHAHGYFNGSGLQQGFAQ